MTEAQRWIIRLATQFLDLLNRLLPEPKQRIHFDFAIKEVPNETEVMMFEATVKNTKALSVKVNPVDDRGTSQNLDGDVSFVSDDPDVTIQRVDANTVILIPADGIVKDVTIEVSGDADPGAGTVTITAQLMLHVVNPMATGFGFETSEVDKPPVV